MHVYYYNNRTTGFSSSYNGKMSDESELMPTNQIIGGRGGRVDTVISDAAVGHTLVDIVVINPTRRDFVERAAKQDLVAATDAERRKETHYRDCAAES